jgi:hypothetical protein
LSGGPRINVSGERPTEIGVDAGDLRWRELERRREALWMEQRRLGDLIAATMPTTAAGVAIVAAVLLEWHRETGEGHYYETDQSAGQTLARHILANTPPEVLRRAGLAA